MKDENEYTRDNVLLQLLRSGANHPACFEGGGRFPHEYSDPKSTSEAIIKTAFFINPSVCLFLIIFRTKLPELTIISPK